MDGAGAAAAAGDAGPGGRGLLPRGVAVILQPVAGREAVAAVAAQHPPLGAEDAEEPAAVGDEQFRPGRGRPDREPERDDRKARGPAAATGAVLVVLVTGLVLRGAGAALAARAFPDRPVPRVLARGAIAGVVAIVVGVAIRLGMVLTVGNLIAAFGALLVISALVVAVKQRRSVPVAA